MQPGEICLLENLRFHEEEEKNDSNFSKSLAKHFDVFAQRELAIKCPEISCAIETSEIQVGAQNQRDGRKYTPAESSKQGFQQTILLDHQYLLAFRSGDNPLALQYPSPELAGEITHVLAVGRVVKVE